MPLSFTKIATYIVVMSATVILAFAVATHITSLSGKIVTLFITIIILSNCIAKLFYIFFINDKLPLSPR